ncbi:MAG: formate dehydrogenase subunit alpha [Nitrospirota bacterium]|nr:formate dehydrogenase subunit alpha [Nitrospirota bacterium]
MKLPSGDVMQVTVNGVPVTVASGASLLDAARAAGVEPPTLCHMRGLPPEGTCRLCAVMLEGVPRPVPACHTPCAEGARITTDTPELIAARRQVVALLLADHPAPCRPPGDPRGECELERLAAHMGLPIHGEAENHSDRAHPAIAVALSACVQCGRCIRACSDLQGHRVIGWDGLGPERRLAFSGVPALAESACVACGQCVAACPTGALSPSAPPMEGMTAIDTICPYCGVGCGITCHVAEGAIHAVTSELKYPANQGRLCVKGRFGLDFVTSPERLTTPLMRKDSATKTACGRDGFREASWDEALTRVADSMRNAAQRNGGRAVGGLGSAKCTNEDNYLFQKWLRAGLGSHNVDHCARLCHSASVSALAAMVGSGAATNPNTDFLKADAIFLIGTNTLETHPVIATFVRQAQRGGTRLVVADPRRVGLALEADLHLQQRPGTDPWLVSGMAREVLDAGLADRHFIDTHTEGFPAYREGLLALDMAELARVTGVSRFAMRQAAQVLGNANTMLTGWGMGLTQHVAGTVNCAAVAGLALLTGNLGRPGAGLNPLRGQSNVQGASDMGVLPNVLPGYQPVADPQALRKFADAWGRDLPDAPGLTVVEMMRAARAGELTALHVMGENPALSDPDLGHVAEALERLEFLVVQDVFFTETCAFADVILPAASTLERAGSVTNTERRVQPVTPVLHPPGMARADGDILADLLRKTGFEHATGDPAEVMAEMAALTPLYGGMSAERLQKGALCWPCPTADHPGTEILHANGPVRGRAAFLPPRLVPPAEAPDAEFPLLLTTGRILTHYQTGTLSRHASVLDALVHDPWAELHPDTLREAGLKDGARAVLGTRRGTVEVTVRQAESALPGVVFVPYHFAEAPVNRLVHDQLDPESKIPEYKCVAARIAPLA